MTTKAFLNHLYRSIRESFPDVTIAYEYEELSRTHLIRVTPQSIYDSDEFLDLEADLNQLWIAKSINTSEEDFCIVSTNSLTQLEQPQIVYIPEPTHAFSASGQELEEKGYTIDSSAMERIPEFEGFALPEFESASSEQYSLAA